MAILIRLRDSVPIPLTASSLAGRAPSCWLQLDHRFASHEHARLAFTSSGWVLKDIGSTNGTYVDGRRLNPGSAIVLSPGARIGFGQVEPAFEVADVSPPRAVAQDVETGEIIAGVCDLLALPNDDSPEAMIYPGASGWILESRSEKTSNLVDNLQVVKVGTRLFRLFLPVPTDATPMLNVAYTIANATLRFAIDSQQEPIVVELLFRGIAVARLESTAYGPLLLALARARLQDGSRPRDERGWRSVDELCDQMSTDPAALNVAIHRARRRLALTKVTGASDIIEVKRGMRRLTTDRIEIVSLSELRR